MRTATAACTTLLLLVLLAACVAASVPEFTIQEAFSPIDGPESNWEPALVKAYQGERLYWLSTFTTGHKRAPCAGCPDPLIALRTSDDNGRSWHNYEFVCDGECQRLGVTWQYDPAAAVSTAEGHLYMAWLNNFNITFARSDNGGKTLDIFWECVDDGYSTRICPTTGGSDKPWLGAVGENDVFLFYNRVAMMVTVSHDGGKSFEAPLEIANNGSKSYFYPSSSLTWDQTVCVSASCTPALDHHHLTADMYILCSSDGGATWVQDIFDVSLAGPHCPDWAGCDEKDFLMPQPSICADGAGTVYALNGHSDILYTPSRMLLRRSLGMANTTNFTWSLPVDVSLAPVGAHHAFPMVACGNTSGDVRVAWFDNRTSFWNVYYRESFDGGNTFSAEVPLSNDDSAKLPWKSTSGMGFLWPFGDYGQMLVDSEGFTQAVWGEGTSWNGTGTTYHIRQTQRWQEL